METNDVVHEQCIFPVIYSCGHFEFRIIEGGTTIHKYERITQLENEKCTLCNKIKDGWIARLLKHLWG